MLFSLFCLSRSTLMLLSLLNSEEYAFLFRFVRFDQWNFKQQGDSSSSKSKATCCEYVNVLWKRSDAFCSKKIKLCWIFERRSQVGSLPSSGIRTMHDFTTPFRPQSFCRWQNLVSRDGNLESKFSCSILPYLSMVSFHFCPLVQILFDSL